MSETGGTIAIDIWLTKGKDAQTAIELKYHKAAYEVEISKVRLLTFQINT